jgi:hypothetical protein
MSNADKFFGKLNSVLQWNSSRCKSREFLLKRFELGLNSMAVRQAPQTEGETGTRLQDVVEEWGER